MIECPVTKCVENIDGQCSEAKCAYPELYRRGTKACETCGVSMKAHPTCAACGVLLGVGHLSYAEHCREYTMCGYCVKAWQRLDSLARRETTLAEFKDPTKLKKLRGD